MTSMSRVELNKKKTRQFCDSGVNKVKFAKVAKNGKNTDDF